ncbi:MAG: pyridoxal phosphate-dependent aminotransferase [Candidatus Atribacteria bacterium]|nr:pyridoxal phosphate-dependent aminotransferase [Candidatus Atribacteria bacterium]
MKISQKVNLIEPSATLTISARAKTMKKNGLNVLSFSAGEPDFDTPQCIKDAAKLAIDQGFTKYTPTSGILELKEAICHKLKKENGLTYHPDEVIVSCGAKHSLFNAILTLCDTDDEVLLPVPYWVTYVEQIRLAGGKPVFILCDPKTLRISWEDILNKITDKTKLIIINNPSNPSGIVWELETLKKIADLAIEKDILIISDEIYENLIYDGAQAKSIASFSPEAQSQTIVINGVSKTFSMTGWRIGYTAGPKAAIQAMGRLQDHSTSNPTSISQKAALAALQCDQQIIQNMVKLFNQRRLLMIQLLHEIPDITFPVPQGAFYIFADFSSYLGRSFDHQRIDTSLQLAEILLEKALIAAVPGSAFGMEGYLRFSYATSEENIEKGMTQLKNFLLNIT